MGAVEQMYGGEQFYGTTAIVTMAPELDPDGQVCIQAGPTGSYTGNETLNSMKNASFSGVKS